MFLKSMTLHNFRCFSDLEIEFNNRLTVLVGSNGAGKTTVLEAATVAAGTLISAMDGLTNLLWSSIFVTLQPNFCYRVYATP